MTEHPTTSRPIKAIYNLATLGSKTQQGGEVVTATTGINIDGHRIARVGDMVRYPDGTECAIVSGAGIASVHNGQSVALVGSGVANGDTIIESLQSSAQIIEYADGPSIPGLFQAGFVPPAVANALKDDK